MSCQWLLAWNWIPRWACGSLWNADEVFNITQYWAEFVTRESREWEMGIQNCRQSWGKQQPGGGSCRNPGKTGCRNKRNLGGTKYFTATTLPEPLALWRTQQIHDIPWDHRTAQGVTHQHLLLLSMDFFAFRTFFTLLTRSELQQGVFSVCTQFYTNTKKYFVTDILLWCILVRNIFRSMSHKLHVEYFQIITSHQKLTIILAERKWRL